MSNASEPPAQLRNSAAPEAIDWRVKTLTTPPPGATRLGILSDTHGRADACGAAVKVLLEMGAQAFAHCGDVGEEPVLDQLAGQAVWFVWGNNDIDRSQLGRYAAELGLTCLNSFDRFRFAGKQFAITHGDDGAVLRAIRDAALAGSAAPGAPAQDDYLLSGHTHVPHDQRLGRLRWINPGALFRARPRTVALLDVASDKLTLREMP